MTQTLKAKDLADLKGYGPLFIDDGEPQSGVNGAARFARKVTAVNVHFDASLSDHEHITVEFADGTPGRLFALEDDVVVHSILPGTDLRS